MVGPAEVSEKFMVVGGGGGWSSDNTVSKVQVPGLLDLTFGLDLDLDFRLTILPGTAFGFVIFDIKCHQVVSSK